MNADLAQKAVTAALTGKWDEAISINNKLLRQDSKDIDALNRLARAYAEKGNIKRAKSTAQKVLKIDPFNPIAGKAVARWKGLRSSLTGPTSTTTAEAFLEEPGKTKIISLLHLGDATVLAKLDSGDEVLLTPHSHRVSVVTSDTKYIGRLPDDLSARLRKLISMGNEYKVLVKSTSPEDVRIFIREVKRSEKLGDFPSFPAEKIDYISFTPPELVHKKSEKPILEIEEE
jgi:tetratricopeptide (TPR) repeat protein